MELIDTHCHLDFPDFKSELDQVIARALTVNVKHMITIGIDPASSAQAIELSRQYDCISATVGHHPHEASSLTNQDLESLKILAAEPEVVAFGEIGLDFYRDLSPRLIQRTRFDDLINIALDLRLPLIIHDRDAHQEVLEHLTTAKNRLAGGIIHCYSGDYQQAIKFLDLGFLISIPGTVTFPKAAVIRDVVARLPLDVLLVETDAPFLAPVPRRGKRNEPAWVLLTAQEIAAIKKVPLAEVAEVTTANARRIFKLSATNHTESSASKE
ncbi:MAG: TatD family hydrolase [Deltaproteobacteria bacterium]|nr:TatD family hydrolase [Deltaproteobacteria bacterium]